RRDARDVGGWLDVERPHQLAHRHGREEVVTVETATRAAVDLARLDRDDAPTGGVHAIDLPPEVHLAAALAHLARDLLPELPRTELRIEEALDQAGLGLLLLDRLIREQERAHRVPER